MSTPTKTCVDQHRRLTADRVLAQMRKGAQLLLHYANGKPIWLLDPGGEVAPKTALDVINTSAVSAVGDSLFADCPAQTFRYVES